MYVVCSSVLTKDDIPEEFNIILKLSDEDLEDTDTLDNPVNLLNIHFQNNYSYQNYELSHIQSFNHNQDDEWRYTAKVMKQRKEKP